MRSWEMYEIDFRSITLHGILVMIYKMAILDNSSIFRSSISPMEPYSFLENKWQSQHLLIQRNNSHYYDTNLSWNMTKEFIKNVPTRRYMKSWNSTYFNMSKHPIDDYSSIVLNNFQKDCDVVLNIVHGFQQIFHHRTQANVYISPPLSQALPVHFDWMDVFVFQMEGSKHWDIYSPLIMFPRPTMHFPITNTSNLQHMTSIHLNRGDMLYIPSGWIHQARTLSQSSTHLTIGVESTYLGSWESIITHSLLRHLKTDSDTFLEYFQKPLRQQRFETFIRNEIVDGIVWGHFLLFIIKGVGTRYHEFRKSIPFSLVSKDNIRTSVAQMFRTILHNFDVSRSFSEHKINMDVFDNELRERFMKHSSFFMSIEFHYECRHALVILYRYFMYNFDTIMNQFLKDVQLHMIQ